MAILDVVLPDELNVRLQQLIDTTGSSRHFLMLKAIERFVEQEELNGLLKQPLKKRTHHEGSLYSAPKNLDGWLSSHDDN